MVGGGHFGLAPGQITDDGELTLALTHAIEEAGGDDYDPLITARWYRKWMLSEPFDVGFATSNALGSGDLSSPLLDTEIYENAISRNAESMANGSLMRATPIGILGSKLSLEKTVEIACTDACLTHPNPACQLSTAAYAVAIRHLILNESDNIGAFNAALAVVDNSNGQEVDGWLRDAQQGYLPTFYPRSGFVRIAFTHAFFHLYNNTPYLEALQAILAGGGDTDTNACIAGGLIGASCGLSEIPKSMINAVIQCDTQKGSRPRPDWLHLKPDIFA